MFFYYYFLCFSADFTITRFQKSIHPGLKGKFLTPWTGQEVLTEELMIPSSQSAQDSPVKSKLVVTAEGYWPFRSDDGNLKFQ